MTFSFGSTHIFPNLWLLFFCTLSIIDRVKTILKESRIVNIATDS